MRIYLINLAKDQHRLAAMTEQLNRLNLPFERIEAIYGTNMPDGLKSYFLNGDGSIASRLSPGEVGCYASHIKALWRIAEDEKPAFVFEDDLDIAEDFGEIIDGIDRLPQDWEIVRLSNHYKRHFVPACRIGGQYQAVKFSRIPQSSAAYLITPEAAQKFLNWRLLRTAPIDRDLQHVWHCGLTTYGVYPQPILAGIGPSTIAAMGPIQAPRLRPLSEHIRRIRHDIRWLGLKEWALSLTTRPHA